MSSLYDKPKDLKPYCEVKLYHSSRSVPSCPPIPRSPPRLRPLTTHPAARPSPHPSRHKARSKSVPVDKGTDAVVWDQHLGAWDVEDDDLIFIRSAAPPSLGLRRPEFIAQR